MKIKEMLLGAKTTDFPTNGLGSLRCNYNFSNNKIFRRLN